MANDELRRVPPGIVDMSWQFCNLGGNAGITSRPFIGMRGLFIFKCLVLLVVCVKNNKRGSFYKDERL